MNCPKCDAEMERIPHEPDVGIEGGWACEDCGVFVHEADTDCEPDDWR